MPAKRFRARIFDIGRALARVDFRTALTGIAKSTPLTAEEIWRAIQKHPLWRGWQEGRVSPQEWHRGPYGRLQTGPAIFQEALRSCGLGPGEAVFIDNAPEYVEAA